MLWERLETVIWKTVELHTPEGTKASFIIGSDHIQQWQTLILKPLESCSQSPCCTSVNNIYTLIFVPDGGSLCTHSRKEGKMQSCIAISPHRSNSSNRETLGLRNCFGNPHPSQWWWLMYKNIFFKKRILTNYSDGLPCGAGNRDFCMAGQ